MLCCRTVARRVRPFHRTLCSFDRSGGGGFLLVPERERHQYLKYVRDVNGWVLDLSQQITGQREPLGFWDASTITGLDKHQLEMGFEAAFRSVCSWMEDEEFDWDSEIATTALFPGLRSCLQRQCEIWRAMGWSPSFDLPSSLTVELLTPLPRLVKKGVFTRAVGDRAAFPVRWMANCTGLSPYSVAMDFPVVITSKSGTMSMPGQSVGLGSNCWVFSCIPNRALTMNEEDFQFVCSNINGAVRLED